MKSDIYQTGTTDVTQTTEMGDYVEYPTANENAYYNDITDGYVTDEIGNDNLHDDVANHGITNDKVSEDQIGQDNGHTTDSGELKTELKIKSDEHEYDEAVVQNANETVHTTTNEHEYDEAIVLNTTTTNDAPTNEHENDEATVLNTSITDDAPINEHEYDEAIGLAETTVNPATNTTITPMSKYQNLSLTITVIQQLQQSMYDNYVKLNFLHNQKNIFN